jgi:hypothetical protein
VRALDAVGNRSATASFSWTVDAIAPDAPTFTQTPTDPSGPDVTFAFEDTEATATFECSIDAAAFAPCASPLELLGLADGPHSLDVRALDAVGNRSATASFSWTVEAG